MFNEIQLSRFGPASIAVPGKKIPVTRETVTAVRALLNMGITEQVLRYRIRIWPWDRRLIQAVSEDALPLEWVQLIRYFEHQFSQLDSKALSRRMVDIGFFLRDQRYLEIDRKAYRERERRASAEERSSSELSHIALS